MGKLKKQEDMDKIMQSIQDEADMYADAYESFHFSDEIADLVNSGVLTIEEIEDGRRRW